MRASELSVEEEPVIKKVKTVENSSEIPMLSEEEPLTELDGNEQVPLLDTEEKTDTRVASDNANMEKAGNENDASVTSKDEVPVVENKDPCVASGNDASVTSKDEVPAIENKDPCVASGGIKEDIRSNLLVSPKKLLVLDLNGLLADIVSGPTDIKPDAIINRRKIFKRPFCEDFLKFCFDKFEVGIWSSRKEKNVVNITKYLLGDMMSKLLFCWDVSHCSSTTVASLENEFKNIVFKDLNRLWRDPKIYYNETNTVLLDDSPYKALLNPPYTAIFPHTYNHKNKATDTSLGDGGDLRLHLEKLVEADNVQDFIKNNPYGQEAITKTSEHWELYEQAIRTIHISSQT